MCLTDSFIQSNTPSSSSPYFGGKRSNYFSPKKIGKQTSQIRIVGRFGELEGMTVVEVIVEFLGISVTELVEADFDLVFHDACVLLLFRLRTDPLPGKLAAEEVHQHIAK